MLISNQFLLLTSHIFPTQTIDYHQLISLYTADGDTLSLYFPKMPGFPPLFLNLVQWHLSFLELQLLFS